jgi:hypothetical protein
MLEDARADSGQRVPVLSTIYAERDNTAANAVRYAATLDGAMDVLDYALSKANLQRDASVDALTPDAVIKQALELLGVELKDKGQSDPK